MNEIHQAIYIGEDEKNKIGFKCSFCNRIYDDFEMVIQVVVVKRKKKSLCWMCNICKNQERYITMNKEHIYKSNTINKDYIIYESDRLVFNRYRKSIWKKG